MANIIVLFEVTIKEGRMDDYLNMAASLKEELPCPPGIVLRALPLRGCAQFADVIILALLGCKLALV